MARKFLPRTTVPFRWATMALLIALGVKNLPADTALLSTGGSLSGEVRSVGEGSDAYVVARVDDQLSVAVTGHRVDRVEPSSELQPYHDLAARCGDDAERHYQLSLWCKRQHLRHQAHFHLQRAIDIDPNHELARAALGYLRRKHRWISREQLHRDQGLIKDREGWMLPEAVAARDASKEFETKSKQWIRKLKLLAKKAQRGDPQALQEIQAIDDPHAVMAISRQLKDGRGGQNRQWRTNWLRRLAAIGTRQAKAAITETALIEPDNIVREEAIRLIQELDPQAAVNSFLGWLRSPDPKQVDLAARALSYFNDPSHAFAYTDALVTKHKKRVQQGGGQGRTQAGFSNRGGGSFSTGGKTVEVDVPVRHPHVLSILKEIAPDADFGYDENRWRRYFAARINPPRSDLRRDP